MDSEEIDVDSLTQSEIEDLCTDYTRYVVALGLISQVGDEEAKTHFYSGFLMEFGSDWYWITAGHILEGIEAAQAYVERFRLIDCFGRGGDKHPIPFDYPSAWKFYRHTDDGLDFAAVQLSSLTRRLLEANDSIAITESQWRTADYSNYDRYIMVGLPECVIHRNTTHGTDGYVVSGKPNPTLILAHKIVPPDYAIVTHPRLVASITEKDPDGDIVGMSGGPIFAASEDPQITIVALQSAWYESARITLGCPISVFAPMIDAAIAAR